MAAGGFDLVLGNPPWEVMQLSEEEFFDQRQPEIAELVGVKRKRAIAALEAGHPSAFLEYQQEKRRFEAANEFARASGRFDLTARGKVNTYGLFAELFASLASERGRAGLIVPTGIATDATMAQFFSAQIQAERLVSLFSFYEVRGWFKGTDDRKSFCLLTLGWTRGNAEFAFDLKNISELFLPERRFALSQTEIALINPNTKTMPVFRTRADARLTMKLYDHVPVLIDDTKGAEGNPWRAEFRQGLFNMTSDSALFRTAMQLREVGFSIDCSDWVMGVARYLPLYEAKMIHLFDHRWATYDAENIRGSVELEKQDPQFEPTPKYWVPERDVTERLAAKSWNRLWLLGWRDIALRSVERTVIATVIPRVGVNHKIPLMMLDQSPQLAAAMLSNLACLTLDFIARQKIGGTSLAYFYLKQFPILPPEAYSAHDLAFIVQRVLELTYTSHAMKPFARDLGYEGPPFIWNEDRRAMLRAELDAFYARAYGLTRDELRYILDPEDAMGPGYPSETFRVLKQHEIRHYGEYRTARLVLAAWDAQSDAAKAA